MITDAPPPIATQPAAVERLGFTVIELARATGLNPATIREKCRTGEIATARIGWQYIIPASVIRAMFPAAKL